MQIANSSLPVINIPATLTPVIGAATQNPAADATSITGIIAIITAAFGLYQNHMDDKKQDKRTNALADNQLGVVDSIKATDIGAKENAEAINKLATTLAQDPAMKTLLTTTDGQINSKNILEYVKAHEDGWDLSLKEYYQNSPRKDGDFSKDPVLQKTSEAAKMTEPTPDP